jgi:hypothetical protein
MAGAIVGVGLIAAAGAWELALAAPLLLTAGAAHACSFSPLADRLATVVRPAHAADLSGLILTASLVGQVLGVAAFVGVYLNAAPRGAGHALAMTTAAIAAVLAATTACAYAAMSSRRGKAAAANAGA